MPADTHVLTLPSRTNLQEADTLAGQILEALSGQRRVRIVTDAVEDMDVATLQILIAAQRQAARMGRPLEIGVPAGGAMLAALEMFGVADACDARLDLASGVWTGLHDA
ncbi:STAS domain-containing protein [Paracoccaceae bacterium Fryx2]|nr:STAS domain-containing protein [Paracoccaceae bacterium Fryx2]